VALLFWCCALTGLADGRTIVHNIRFDQSIVAFSHAHGGAVTSVGFRSDQTPTLATGSTSGQISVWDLTKKKLITIIKDAHDAPVASATFLPREVCVGRGSSAEH
jgi:U3 small nucleolar RNA-associated protein 21